MKLLFVMFLMGQASFAAGPEMKVSDRRKEAQPLVCKRELSELIKNSNCPINNISRAEVNRPDIYGNYPLHIAIQSKNSKAIFLLLKNGANPFAKNAEDLSPKELAYSLRYYSLYEYLAKIETSSEDLIRAADYNDKNEILRALKEGASLSITNTRNDTPLHIASRSNFFEVLQLLIKNKAEIDARNYLGETALHLAASRGFRESVLVLLKSGADPNKLNHRRESILDLWPDQDDHEVMRLLRKAKATNGSAHYTSLEGQLSGGSPEQSSINSIP
ncbi:MAG: ankyrin repeat domain-containing protein [Oligoflexia bacterium]|nr:ankyrin repeat domain-containing protein [Oligoflexia bacterium]